MELYSLLITSPSSDTLVDRDLPSFSKLSTSLFNFSTVFSISLEIAWLAFVLSIKALLAVINVDKSLFISIDTLTKSVLSFFSLSVKAGLFKRELWTFSVSTNTDFKFVIKSSVSFFKDSILSANSLPLIVFFSNSDISLSEIFKSDFKALIVLSLIKEMIIVLSDFISACLSNEFSSFFTNPLWRSIS